MIQWVALPVWIIRRVIGRAIVKSGIAKSKSGSRNGDNDEGGTSKDRHDSVIVKRNVDAVWAYSIDVAMCDKRWALAFTKFRINEDV